MGKYIVSKRNLMKSLLFFILCNIYGFQDSTLFWYDMNSVFDPIPKTTVIIDDIFKTNQVYLLDSLNSKNQKINVGFRVQLFETISKAPETIWSEVDFLPSSIILFINLAIIRSLNL